jgi:hypothetical protein
MVREAGEFEGSERMSFVITVASPELVVQVSETRLSSLPNQYLVCDNQRKSIIVMGKRAHFVLGWTGLARTGNLSHDTSNWLWQRLYEMNAVQLSLVQILEDLTGLATRDFLALPESARNKRCQFHLAGWHKVAGVPTPFTCLIYNDLTFKAAQRYRLPIFESTGVASSQFMYCLGSFQAVRAPFLVRVMGDFDAVALSSQFRALKGLLKKKPVEPNRICKVCRGIVLEAARLRPNTVGRNLIEVEMDNKGAIRSSYYPDGDQETMLIPDVLSTRGSLIKGTVRHNIAGDQINIQIRGSRIVSAE